MFAGSAPLARLDTVKEMRKLRRECESTLDEMALPAFPDLEMLCAHISSRRGLPLRLIPVSMDPSTPSGIWISTSDEDLIVYESSASRSHQDHIIAHELGHMICHHHHAIGDDSITSVLFPDLQPNLIRDMLRRAGYTDRQEQEAEIMATVVLERVLRARDAASQNAPDSGDEVISRMRSSLIGPGAV